ncbi:MAG: hypothetical protein WStaBPW_24890 [Shewanella algae]|uniref:hypothetical protein n=1 Tax=Shewanella sp. BJSY2023SW005 TaxID=3392043 RepID=UPI0034AB1BF0
MLKRVIIGIVVCFGLVMPIQAQTYKGTLGKYSIMLSIQDDAVSTYMYTRYLKEIPLEREGYTFYQRYSSKEQKLELFELRLVGGNLQGTWQNKQRVLPVHLTPVEQSLADYRAEHMKFTLVGEKQFAKQTIELIKEDHSNFAFYRLGKGFTQAQQAFLNPLLAKLHRDYVSNFLQCEEASYEPQISLVSDEYFSVVIQYQISCGGPHPEYGEQMLNFDLSKLAQLHDLTERFPKLDYYSLLKEKYANNNELQAECEYFESRDNWAMVKWRLTADGVIIQPYYDHSMAPCEVDFFLSTQELND